jgi:hypothetical protein
MTDNNDAKVRRIFTALLVLGTSGAGKTSLLATFAEYLWETYREILLLYSWDGGAIPTRIQQRMHQGIIRFWRARTRSGAGLALETLHLATKGYWPRSIDPRTGETLPAVDLVAPITTKYHLSCDQGHSLGTVPVATLITNTFCAQCKQMIDVGKNLRVREEVKRTKGFEQVGGVAYDGLTSMCDVVMNNQDYLRGHGLIGGEKSSFGGVVQSGSIKFGGNNRADVGFAQTRAGEFVSNSLSIPYLRESPVFTGLSTEGTDKGGLTVIGLDLPGQAALTQAPQWFGNICEATTTQDDNGKPRFTLHLQPFIDPQGRRHLLKTSGSPGGLPMSLFDPPIDAKQPFTQFNLGVLFRMLDEDLKNALAEQDLPEVPGIPAGIVEYGEPVRVEEPVVSSKGSSAGTPSPAATPVQAGTSVPPTGLPPQRPGPQVAGKPSMQAAGVKPSNQGAAPPPAGKPPMRAPTATSANKS